MQDYPNLQTRGVQRGKIPHSEILYVFTAPFTYFKREEWIVFCGVLGYLITLLAVPRFQGAIVSLNYVDVVNDGQVFVISSGRFGDVGEEM